MHDTENVLLCFAYRMAVIFSMFLNKSAIGWTPKTVAWPTVDCYSCMSKGYERYWELLKTLYWPQRNFTDACNDESFDGRKMSTVPCRHICVVLKEPLSVLGLTVGQQYLRGCYDKILLNGFNETAIETHRFRMVDQCKQIDRSKLISGGHLSGVVTMCSCWHNRCNGTKNQLTFSLTLMVFCTLITQLLQYLLLPRAAMR